MSATFVASDCDLVSGYDYVYCLTAGSNFYTFLGVNYVDTGLKQNQMKEVDNAVVDLTGSWKQQKMMKHGIGSRETKIAIQSIMPSIKLVVMNTK